MDFLSDFLSILLFTLWIFIFIGFLIVVFRIVIDIFRDRTTNGWVKALWLILIFLLPALGSLIYLIARGKGMAERDYESAQAVRSAQVEYTKGLVAEATGPAAEIKAAKELLDAGTITEAEYAALKAKALA